MTKKVEISYKTIVFFILFILGLWFLYYIGDLLLEIFVALIISAILSPLVSKLSSYKIPVAVSVFLVYLIVFGIFGLAVAALVPPLLEQTANLVNTLPKNIQTLGLSDYFDINLLKQSISTLGSVPGQIVKAGFNIFNNFLNVLTVLIFAFYLLISRNKLDDSLDHLFGKEKSKYYSKLVNTWENRLGSWARGQILLMLLVGVSSYIGLLLLGIPYALPLALLAGLFEIIPYLGPIIAAVPAVILGFSISPFLGVAAVGLAFLIQQLENYLFVPKIMEKSIGISPVITLFALSVGYRIAGLTGIIISMPVVLTIQVMLREKFSRK